MIQLLIESPPIYNQHPLPPPLPPQTQQSGKASEWSGNTRLIHSKALVHFPHPKKRVTERPEGFSEWTTEGQEVLTGFSRRVHTNTHVPTQGHTVCEVYPSSLYPQIISETVFLSISLLLSADIKTLGLE